MVETTLKFEKTPPVASFALIARAIWALLMDDFSQPDGATTEKVFLASAIAPAGAEELDCVEGEDDSDELGLELLVELSELVGLCELVELSELDGLEVELELVVLLGVLTVTGESEAQEDRTTAVAAAATQVRRCMCSQ